MFKLFFLENIETFVYKVRNSSVIFCPTWYVLSPFPAVPEYIEGRTDCANFYWSEKLFCSLPIYCEIQFILLDWILFLTSHSASFEYPYGVCCTSVL